MRGCIFAFAFVLITGTSSATFAQNLDLFAPNLTGAPGDQVTGPVTLDSSVAMNGLSFGFCHDSAFASLIDASLGSDLAVANGGGPPSFLSVDLGLNNFTIGCVVDLFGINSLNPGVGLELVLITYEIAPGATGTSPLDFCVAGSPPVATSIVVGGMSITPTQTSGSISVLGDSFERGDCNSDGGFNIADAIALLGELFPSGGPSNPITCLDACDGNDDGALNIADAIALLGILFSGTVLPEPVNCGPDPTDADTLDCPMSGAC